MDELEGSVVDCFALSPTKDTFRVTSMEVQPGPINTLVPPRHWDLGRRDVSSMINVALKGLGEVDTIPSTTDRVGTTDDRVNLLSGVKSFSTLERGSLGFV